jgi:uncharacterized membrane protein YtjA (UPF0391 family)
MFKWKYIFLSLSLIELAVGFSDARPTTFFYLGRPLGTILFGLFLIAQVMEKESALYDEQRRAAQPSQKLPEVPEQPISTRREVAHAPSLTAAYSHRSPEDTRQRPSPA